MVAAKSHGRLPKRIGSPRAARTWTESTPMQRMKSGAKKLHRKMQKWKIRKQKRTHRCGDDEEKNKKAQKKV